MRLDAKNVTFAIASGCSLIGGLLMLWRFYHTNKKPVSLKMIVILTISDLLLSLSVLVWTLGYDIESLDSPFILKVLLASCMEFSILWACIIARFVYKSIEGNEISNQEQYLQKSVITCIGFMLVMTVITYVLSNSKSVSTTVALEASILVGFLITIVLLTVWYYFRAIKVLRQYTIELQQAVRPAIRKLNLYAFIQFITLGPYLITREIQILNGTTDSKDINIAGILANLSGLANALIYLFGPQNYIELDDKDSMERSLSQF